MWQNRPLRALMPTGLLFSIVQMCLITFLVTYLVQEVLVHEEPKKALIVAGFIMASVQIAGVTGRPFWGWTADRFGDGLAILIMLALMMAGLSLVMMAIEPSWPKPALFIVFVFFGLSAMGWNGVYIASVVNLIDTSQVGKVTGAILAITFGGVFIGPAVFSSLYPLIGSYGTTYGLLALVALAGGYCAYRSRALKK